VGDRVSIPNVSGGSTHTVSQINVLTTELVEVVSHKRVLIRKDEDKKLHSLGKKYKPLTRILTRPKQQKPAGLPALVKETADPRPVQAMIDNTPKPWGTEASNVLTRINVVEARILYEELRKIFGG
jgi:hypothetical protein